MTIESLTNQLVISQLPQASEPSKPSSNRTYRSEFNITDKPTSFTDSLTSMVRHIALPIVFSAASTVLVKRFTPLRRAVMAAGSGVGELAAQIGDGEKNLRWGAIMATAALALFNVRVGTNMGLNPVVRFSSSVDEQRILRILSNLAQSSAYRSVEVGIDSEAQFGSRAYFEQVFNVWDLSVDVLMGEGFYHIAKDLARRSRIIRQPEFVVVNPPEAKPVPPPPPSPPFGKVFVQQPPPPQAQQLVEVPVVLQKNLMPFLNGNNGIDKALTPERTTHIQRELTLAMNALEQMDDAMPQQWKPDQGFGGGYKTYVNREADATVVLQASDDRWQQRVIEEFQKRDPVYWANLSSESYWIHSGFCAADRDKVGRIYFSLDHTNGHKQVNDFFDELRAMYKRLQQDDVYIGFKMASKLSAIQRADSAVLYFDAADQQKIYDEVVRLYQARPDFFASNTPLFTAQLHSPEGNILKGISFGQNPGGRRVSFGSERAEAISRVLSSLEGRVEAGQQFSYQQVMREIATEFDFEGIDIHAPAFYSDRAHLFDFLRQRTDQAVS